MSDQIPPTAAERAELRRLRSEYRSDRAYLQAAARLAPRLDAALTAAEERLTALIGAIQRYQPTGSPPPGNEVMLADWIFGEMRMKLREAEESKQRELEYMANRLATTVAALTAAEACLETVIAWLTEAAGDSGCWAGNEPPEAARLLAEHVAKAVTALANGKPEGPYGGALGRLGERLVAAEAERDEWAAEREKVANQLIAEEELSKRLEAENARLREALEPFAYLATNPAWVQSVFDGSGEFRKEAVDTQPVSIDHCRAAAAALAPRKEGESV